AIDLLADGRLTLLGLWGEPATVHMALLDEQSNEIAVISLACSAGRFPSVGARHPPALRLERTIRDLFGLEPTGMVDGRSWLDHAARLACRTSGDSAVAYGLAFASSIEAALQLDVPPRARYLRVLFAELERLANHCGDIGAICNDASFALLHAQTGILRERCL